MHNVAILNDIRLTLLSVLSSGFDGAHGLLTIAEIMEVLVRHNFSLDETALKVAVNDTSCLGSQCSLLDRPAADLFLASSEVILQSQLGEACRDC